jgi:hypothetical protein
MWKTLRISVLLFVLFVVAQQALLEDAALDWKHGFRVRVYPVNVDRSDRVASYIRSLQTADFAPIATFIADEGASYQLGLDRPVEVSLGAQVEEAPPEPPKDGSGLSVVWWSLRFRYFAWTHSPNDGIKPHIRLYLLFHDPRKHSVLGHSTALIKGRIGLVNQFGAPEYLDQNLVIAAHELLHTLKAKDKYDPRTSLPVYPDGFAEPDKSPRYPQRFAELMGGRVPIAADQARIPASLREVLIGEKTAREIGWITATE